MLRRNRTRPHGNASRKKARSSGVNLVPETPVMKARAAMGADYCPPARALIPWDNAGASGSLVAAAEAACLLGACERPDQGPVKHPFIAEVSTPNNRRAAAQLIGELGLQGAEGALRLGFTALR